jgi:hypothetical protein
MENPTTEHMSTVKKILHYVKGTINLGCTYKKGKKGLILHGYSDSDMAGDVDDRKSTSGMVFYLGPNPISGILRSKKWWRYLHVRQSTLRRARWLVKVCG